MSAPVRLPAEWEAHAATWIAWPHWAADWPGKLAAVQWVYTEIVRTLVQSEPVEILCHNEAVLADAREKLSLTGVENGFRLHLVATDRSWLRDSMPTGVITEEGALVWNAWKFNAWAKYDNYSLDRNVPSKISELTGIALHKTRRLDAEAELVLEAGAFDSDGERTLLVTEECLLSDVQERNSGLGRKEYEEHFAHYLGIEKTIWLKRGICGDDTHGHIDDVCRYVGPGKVLLAFCEPSDSENYPVLLENEQILRQAVDARGRRLDVLHLPMPQPMYYDSERLPASYANFYIANSVVLVPTFNDANDRVALGIVAKAFPERTVIGIHSVDLVLGLGTLHCLTQQQPEAG